MARIEPSQIRNIAIVGHEGAGKTILVEGLLYEAGIINRMGSIKEKNTASDFDPEEKEAGKSFNCATMSFPYKDRFFNLLDVPGSSDCIGEALTALRAVECALVCVDASSGVKVNTRKIWQEAGHLGLPRFLAITRLDAENTDFHKTLHDIQQQFGDRCIPVFLPDGATESLTRVYSTLQVAEDAPAHAKKGHTKLVEAIVEADDALMEKYLEGAEIGDQDLQRTFTKALLSGGLFPVAAVAAEKGVGTKELLDTLAELAPPPDALPRKARKGGEDVLLEAKSGFVGFVYKTLADEFVTRISSIRVLSGKITSNTSFANRRSGKTERIGPILKMCGKEQKNIEEGIAGDIIAVAKVEDMRAGDTVTDEKTDLRVPEVKFPVPMVSLAVRPKSRGDEQKIGSALKELEGDDRTFALCSDTQTGDLIISGMSDLHLSMMLKRLKRRRKVEVETSPPKIPYKETITRGVKYVEYTHKKQTGGAGQYAKVYIDVEPLERGGGYQFADKIFGGVIDHSFRPSVDKGIQAKMAEGVIAGFPVVDVRVSLVDGKTHPVDSKDIAFQVAGREAFKKAVLQCNPVLLEPIVKIEIVVPQPNMGDIMGDLNGRRGRILTSATEGPMAIIQAVVPMAEVQAYQADLKSKTGGEGSYSVEFDHYDIVPPNIQKAIVESYEKKQVQK